MKYPKLYILISEFIGDTARVQAVFVKKEDAERELANLPKTVDFYNYIEVIDTPIELNEEML